MKTNTCDADVEETFEQLECCWNTITPHSGPIAAYYQAHNCVQGWTCKNHLDRFIANERPRVTRLIATKGSTICGVCRRRFTTPDEFSRMWVI